MTAATMADSDMSGIVSTSFCLPDFWVGERSERAALPKMVIYYLFEMTQTGCPWSEGSHQLLLFRFSGFLGGILPDNVSQSHAKVLVCWGDKLGNGGVGADGIGNAAGSARVLREK
jgi:hypothetical protein